MWGLRWEYVLVSSLVRDDIRHEVFFLAQYIVETRSWEGTTRKFWVTVKSLRVGRVLGPPWPTTLRINCTERSFGISDTWQDILLSNRRRCRVLECQPCSHIPQYHIHSNLSYCRHKNIHHSPCPNSIWIERFTEYQHLTILYYHVGWCMRSRWLWNWYPKTRIPFIKSEACRAYLFSSTHRPMCLSFELHHLMKFSSWSAPTKDFPDNVLCSHVTPKPC